MNATAFFERDRDLFVATQATRGPWSERHQHGGPPAALLARMIESAQDPALFRVARLTVAFHRPLVIGTYRTAIEVVRDGKKVKVVRAHLVDVDAAERPAASAEALLVRRLPLGATGPAMAIPDEGLVAPDACAPFVLPFFTGGDSYQAAMEMRRMRGDFGTGSMAVWMRMRIPVLVGSPPSPLERAMCAGDSGNGVSVGIDIHRFTFVNPDVTLAFAREPVGEWIGLDARTTFGDDGIGLADTRLLDERGAFGRAVQPLILEARA